VTKEGAILTYYQPQLDEWKDYRQLSGRVAFSLTPKGGKPALGVASLRAKTQTDTDSRTVVIKSIEIVDTRFTALAPENLQSMDKLSRHLFPGTGMTVSLDRVVAGVERGQANAKPVTVKTEPPPIFTRESAAVLLFVDGEPVQAPIEGTSVTMIVNTNWTLFFDEGSKYYFLLQDPNWLTAAALAGPWAATKSLPPDFAKLPAAEEFADMRAAIPPKSTGVAARVHVVRHASPPRAEAGMLKQDGAQARFESPAGARSSLRAARN
jgi:hypothetical protein